MYEFLFIQANFAAGKIINMRIVRFLRDWTLIISIVAGIAAYFIYVNISFLSGTRAFAHRTIGILQPLLIFAMLFLTFCKVNPRKLRFRMWHLWLLLIQ